jgi:hypothetical protein
MLIRVAPRIARRRAAPAVWSAVRLLTLALGVALPAHDLVYAAGHGTHQLARALGDSGHAPFWAWAVTAALSSLALIAAGQLGRWRRLSTRLEGLKSPAPAVRPLRVALRRPPLRVVARLWLPLLTVALAIFVVQENVEHYLRHAGHVPLLEVLFDREYVAAVPVFGAMTLVVAAARAAIQTKLARLVRALRIAERWSILVAADATVRRAGTRVADGHRSNSLGIPGLGRAPPRILVA